MSVLLIAEHDNSNLKVFTLNAISAASQIDVDIHVLVAGNNCEAVTKEVAAIPLVKKVLYSDSRDYEHYLAENLSPLIVKLSERYTHIISSANTFGKNFMPRVAALLDISQVSDIVKINSPDTFVRPIYAGYGFATVKSNDKKKCITIRPTSFDPAPTSGGSSPIEKLIAKDLGVDISNRIQQLKVEEPPKRKGGIKVANVAELVSKLKNEAKVI